VEGKLAALGRNRSVINGQLPAQKRTSDFYCSGAFVKKIFPYISVGLDDGNRCVVIVEDYELFDFVEDFLGDECDLSYHEQAPDAWQRVAGKQLRVMFVDDHEDAAEMLSLVIQTAGHIVVIKRSAEAALKDSQGEVPTVFFLDFGLEWMDTPWPNASAPVPKQQNPW
jgi:CheY-like chemotaxis protein